MVRKRGFDNSYERLGIKKRSPSSPQSTPSNSIEVSNSLNDGLLSLYKQELSESKKESTDLKSVEKNEIADRSLAKLKNQSEESVTPSSVKRGKKSTRIALNLKNYPKLNFDYVGGIDHIVKELFAMFQHFENPVPYQKLKYSRVRGCLLYGPPGCGKTFLVHAMSGEFQLPIIEVTATQLVSGISGESEKEIREIFDEAIKLGPCILFFDGIDAICPKRENANGGMEKRMVLQMLNCFDELKEKDVSFNVIVIGATNDPDLLDVSLRGSGRFDRELGMGIPNEASRLEILKILCEGYKLSVDLSWVAHRTAGYVGADLISLLTYVEEKCMLRLHEEPADLSNAIASRRSFCSVEKQTARVRYHSFATSKEVEFCLETKDFEEALQICVPYCKREGFASVPAVTWEDIGALENVKKELQRTVLWPVKYTKLYEENYFSSTNGMLLYGPKGCGKTLVAKALANECNINFLSVNGPELLNMYLGESEKAVRRTFERAQNSAPCVLFFDEFDALCPSRTSSNSNAAADRVVNQLLTEMDGIQERKQVFVIAATNRKEKIDSAVLRPGRLGKLIFVGLPTPAGRVEILKSLTKNKTRPRITDDLDLETIAFDQRCEEFSGADLAYLIHQASSIAMEEVILSSKERLILNKSHFDKAFEVVKPSFSEADRRYFEKYSRQKTGS